MAQQRKPVNKKKIAPAKSVRIGHIDYKDTATLRKFINEEKMAVILVEQSARKILPLTDRAIILERGGIAWTGSSAALLEDKDALATLLAVAEKK